MKARIVGQNHLVTSYTVNGRKRYIVEDIPITANRSKVNQAVSHVGREWQDVYNWLDKFGGITPPLSATIDSMTY